MAVWTNVSTLPYSFYYGSAVVLDGEIHILGGVGNYTNHYKYSNGSWTNVSTLPYVFYDGSAVVLDDEIHILGSYGSNYCTKHYKYSHGSWTEVSTLPYDFYQGSVIVLDGEIHILGSYLSGYRTEHYKYSNGSWTNVSTLPYSFYDGSAVVLDGEIHILGTYSPSIYRTKHYKYYSPINKVVYGDKTLIDLTSDTITENKLATGYTAHDSSGNSIIGTRPKYFQKNSSKFYHIKGVYYTDYGDYLYKSQENIDVPTFKMLNNKQIYLRNSGTNMLLVVIKDDQTESTITIGTVGANYKNDFYIKDVLFLDRCRCIIHYYSKNGDDTYTAQSIRLITIKNDGVLVQSSAITIANATTASLRCYGRITPMFNATDSFLLIQYRQTVSSGATILYASRAQANFTTGALSIPSSSAWVTVSANNVNTKIFLNTIINGGFFYQNASGVLSIFIWNGYYSGYKNSTAEAAGLYFYSSQLFHSYILGKGSNGEIYVCIISQDENYSLIYSLMSFYYDPINHYFKKKHDIIIDNKTDDPVMMIMLNNSILMDNKLFQIDNTGNFIQIIDSLERDSDYGAYIDEINTGPESDLFNGYYLYGD